MGLLFNALQYVWLCSDIFNLVFLSSLLKFISEKVTKIYSAVSIKFNFKLFDCNRASYAELIFMIFNSSEHSK